MVKRKRTKSKARREKNRTSSGKARDSTRSSNAKTPARSGHFGDNRARITSLDTLRGVAITLMAIDHIADLLFELPIRDSSLRLATRLSMPLFCVLMGFFCRLDTRFRFERLLQIALATILANLIFYPRYHVVEILGCLLLASLAFRASGKYFAACAAALFVYPWDPLASWFDFPPTIVVSFVAVGWVLHRHGFRWALAASAILSTGAIWIEHLQPDGVNHKLCYFILPAIMLVHLGRKFPDRRIPVLDKIGQYPLTAYVTQYYLISIIAYWLTRP